MLDVYNLELCSDWRVEMVKSDIMFIRFGLWRVRLTPGTQAADTLVPQSITLRDSRCSLDSRTDV